MKNTGTLRIQAFAARQSSPVEGVTVTVSGNGFTAIRLTDAEGRDHEVTMVQKWPVKQAVRCYTEKPRPSRIMETTASFASSRLCAMITPLPRARPSAFTTTGTGAVSRYASAASMSSNVS